MRIIKKLKLLVILMTLSFAAAGICQEQSTKTYYNNKVPYAAFFQNQTTNKLKVQVQTKGGKKVQAEIPVVNDVKKDKTQTKGN